MHSKSPNDTISCLSMYAVLIGGLELSKVESKESLVWVACCLVSSKNQEATTLFFLSSFLAAVLTPNHHDNDTINFLVWCVGCHITEPDRRESGKREIE